jgi:opacity protein-like surface antigen
MRSARVAVLVTVIMATAAGLAHAQSESGSVTRSETITRADVFAPRWEIWLGAQVGAPRGFVKVGEFDRPGTKLALHHDLGIDTFEVAELGAAWHITDRDALRARFDYTFLWGGTRLDGNVAFNGALLNTGTNLRTRPVFSRITGLYEHAFVRKRDGTLLAGGAGLTYVYLHWKMTGTLSEQTIGHETGEDFYAQELPVPLLSFRGEYPITPRLHLLGAIDGGGLPKVDSLRNEGGTVKLAQAHVDVFAGVRYMVTPRLVADGGYTYTYFSQHETSREDDNKLLFLGHGVALALTYLF